MAIGSIGSGDWIAAAIGYWRRVAGTGTGHATGSGSHVLRCPLPLSTPVGRRSRKRLACRSRRHWRFRRNHISQPFTSAVDRLSSIELWLDGGGNRS